MSAILEALHRVVAGESLKAAAAEATLEEVLGGGVSPQLVAALLTALRMKGETAEELVGFARALRARAVRVECGEDSRPLIDVSGTGGDEAATFNISTAAALVAAGAGARVAKHGNRSISSKCGSADVLEELGVRLDPGAEQAGRCVREAGIGFLFAPAFHPAMKHVQPIRTELKMRTIFNVLGPLANPAGADYQLIGVFAGRLVPLVGEALAELGVKRGLVVHGEDGLDEITTTGRTLAASIEDGLVRTFALSPADFGVAPATGKKLAGGDRKQNATLVRRVLAREPGPQRDIVLVNAAAALVTCELARDWGSGMTMARESIDSGRAMEKLTRLIEFSR